MGLDISRTQRNSRAISGFGFVPTFERFEGIGKIEMRFRKILAEQDSALVLCNRFLLASHRIQGIPQAVVGIRRGWIAGDGPFEQR